MHSPMVCWFGGQQQVKAWDVVLVDAAKVYDISISQWRFNNSVPTDERI